MITQGERILSEDDNEIYREFLEEKLTEAFEKIINTNMGNVIYETGIIKKKWNNEL